MDRPAAEGTADYNKNSSRNKSKDLRGSIKDAWDTIKSTKRTKKQKYTSSPVAIKPDRSPPQPHRMGKYTWDRQDRKLDALFAIYVLGWETKQNKYTEWRYWIKPVNNLWESDILPYSHDDTRLCYRGIEKLREENIYLTINTRKDGYEVSTDKISVRDKDLNFAIMATCLLVKGISGKVIEYAWNNQDDYSIKAKRRKLDGPCQRKN